MSFSLGFFLGGIVVAGLGYITAYFTQLAYYNDFFWKDKVTHQYWLFATVVLALLGIIFFAVGSLYQL